MRRARAVAVFSLILLVCVAAPVLAKSIGEGGMVAVSGAQVATSAALSGTEASGGGKMESGSEAGAPPAPEGPSRETPIGEPGPSEESPADLLRGPDLETPRAIAEREDSRLAYTDLTPAEGQDLLQRSFADQLQAIAADPSRLLAGAGLEEVRSPTEALAIVEGEPVLIDSSLPLRAPNAEGQQSKVDLGLRETEQGYAPANPLVDVQIPRSAGGRIVIGDEGFSLSLQGAAPKQAATPTGEGGVFAPEAVEDTSLLLAPISTGLELSAMLASRRSPEQLSFSVSLPKGDLLHAAPDGGAEVLGPKGEVAYRVSAPQALDAQGTALPVKLAVQGDVIVLAFSHRELDVAYPILIDPEFVEEGWSSLMAANKWQWEWSGVPSPETYIGNTACIVTCWGSGLYVRSRSNTTYPAGSFGRWKLNAPGSTAYFRFASVGPLHFDPHGCTANEPHGYFGLWRQSDNGWSMLGNAYPSGWTTELSTGLGVSLSSATRTLFLALSASSASNIKCGRDYALTGATFYFSDPENPIVSGLSGIPSGWIRQGTPFTITEPVSDPGLGVKSVLLSSDLGESKQELVCSGSLSSTCPASHGFQFSVDAGSFPEGERTISASAKDILGKSSNTQEAVLKIDRTKPGVLLKGQLAQATEEEGGLKAEEEDETAFDPLHLPVYDLTIEATDVGAETDAKAKKRSGVKSVELFLDGAETPLKTWSNASCPAGSCPLTATYPLKLNGLSADTHHTLRVLATDFAGNEPRERKISFEYVPATGEKVEYVMQHFPLFDAEAEPEEGVEASGPELAVNLMNGNLVFHQTDVEVPGPAADLEVERFYNSLLPEDQNTEWGDGWTLAQTPELQVEEAESDAPEEGTLIEESGAVESQVALPIEAGEEEFDPKLQATIAKEPNGGYALSDETGESAGTVKLTEAGETSELETSEYAGVDYDYSGGELSRISVKDLASAGGLVPPEPPESVLNASPSLRSGFASAGSGEGQLSHPAGLAVDVEGDVWVADRGNNRLEEFGPDGKFLGTLGGKGAGEGQFLSPSAVAIAPDGDIWVADTGNDRVEKFDASGKFIKAIVASGAGNLDAPEGLAVDSHGDVWVADTGNGRIELFDEDGEFVEAVRPKGMGSIEPVGVAAGPGGNIWFADWANDRIVELSESGSFLRAFGLTGSEDGQLQGPTYIAVDASGDSWVADQGNHRVQEFDAVGEFVAEFGSLGTGPDEFTYPAGLAFDGKGHLFAVDTDRPRQGLAPAGPREGLIAAYSFDEGEGEVARDAFGSHDGVIEHGTWTEGKFGKALSFDGGESCVAVPNGVDLQLGEAFTLEAWVRPGDINQSAPVFFKEAEGFYSYSLFFGALTAGHVQGYVADEPWEWTEVESPATLPINAWSHIAMTSDRTSLRLYVNGSLVDTASAKDAMESAGPLQIGCGSSFNKYFYGKIDEVRIYNRALDEEEIGEDGETAIETPSKAPIAAYSFDEGEGEVARDAFGSHDGVIEHGTWTEGKFGKALSFDGGESCVAVPNGVDLQLGEAFTLEAWVRPDPANEYGPILFKEQEAGSFYSYSLWLGGASPYYLEGFVADQPWEWSEVTFSELLPTNAWSHIAMTSDGETLRLYVNGEQVDSSSSREAMESEGPLHIGCSAALGAPHFSGKIDEVRVYNRALNHEEVEGDAATSIGGVGEGSSGPGRVEEWDATSLPAFEEWEAEVATEVENPSVVVLEQGGLVESVEGDEAGRVEYDHDGEMLTAVANEEGETTYEYDEAGHMTKVELLNGTHAEIGYEATYGRVAWVKISIEGGEPKTTHFEYTDSPSRSTRIVPDGAPATVYDMAADGSFVRWRNDTEAPEIELAGVLVDPEHRETATAIASGAYLLEVNGQSEEGIEKIEVITNGNLQVDEKTCEEDFEEEGVECRDVTDQWVLETGGWPPGILYLEAIVTDREGHEASERFWVNIPQTTPPGPEAEEAPTYHDVKEFREEFGLDLDLKGDEGAINERIFSLLRAWNNPYTPAGEVARATSERWGVPLRQVDAAELEYRAWFYEVNADRIDRWVEETKPSTFAGYYIDHKAGGIMHIGFTSNQESQLASIESSLSLVGTVRLRVYPTVPSASYVAVQATTESVLNAIESNLTLASLIVNVEDDEAGKATRVGTQSVAQVEAILSQIFGPNAPIAVEYESGGGAFLDGRYRTSGRMRSGDYINSDRHSLVVGPEGETLNTGGPCTAAFGAKDPGQGPHAKARLFLLTAGHCAAEHGEEVWRNKYDGDFEFPYADAGKTKVGTVARVAFLLDEYGGVRTDAAAIKIEQGGIVPRSIWGRGGHPLPTKPATRARVGDPVCYSGAISTTVACGRVVARSLNYRGDGGELPFGLAGYWVKFRQDKRPQHGDSGSPVWNADTGASIGLVSYGRPSDSLAETLVMPLLHPPNVPANRVPGILHQQNMRPLQLVLGG